MIRTALLNVLLAVCAIGTALAAPVTLDTVNLAGRQRMLGQRIIKNRIQLALRLLPERAGQQQAESVQAFETALRELKSQAISPLAQQLLREEGEEWQRFLLLLPAASNAEALRQLDTEGEKLLASCQALALVLQDEAGSDAGRKVNLAGRTRMLSQRMAKYYLLGRVGKLSNSQRDQAEQTRAELQGAMSGLLAGELVPTVQRELELGRQQWFFFDAALNQTNGDPAHVATSSENLVEVMEKVANLLSRR
ncbi:type IV pili methyl-accepting chemotaxis transducer N-terminal domain-containing protein [Chitinimonas sp.]|uniref:type IV pili methyl-accepting chemotaxis transducer N-terminal domain-containing protein n=1 Tax=Chitinimonas sp. TaxID=1934313 RepID=UPI0035AD7C0E